MNQSILIIGAGKLGTSLFRALKEKGFPSVTLAGNKTYDTMNGTFLHIDNYSPVLTGVLIRQNTFIFICVKDGQIKGLTEALLPFDLNNTCICHTSGSQTSQILGVLRDKGARTGSFHPMQTFAAEFSAPEVWKSVFCTYEGDTEALTLLETICHEFEAHLHRISPEQKVKLHLAASIVSNFGVALISWAESVLRTADIDASTIKELLLPLLHAVAGNYTGQNVHHILTGPLQRGDLDILNKHISALNGTQKKLYLDFARLLADDHGFDIRNREALKDFIDANRN